MRITHVVCTDAFAGVERYVADVGRRQVLDGHEVVVVGGSPTEVPRALDGSGVIWAPGTTVPRAQWSLLHHRPDVVHAHMTAAEVAAVGTRPLHRRPIVATLHFAQPRGGDRRRARAYRWLARHLDAQIAISRFVAERSGGAPEVIPNGVPWDEPAVPRRPVVLVAQRLQAEKDTATAIRAWATSGLAERGWTLELAGDGDERGAVDELIEHLGVGASVRRLGFVPDARRRIAEASVFLATAPSEPFGLSVVEAMAAGTPVVAAAGGAHLETVGPVGAAWMFEPGDAATCAARLLALAGDEAARHDYGRALRGRWAECYDIGPHCRRLEDVYRRVRNRA